MKDISLREGDRIILHSDLNNFYASVASIEEPELKNIPMVISGDPNLRRGVILAKNNLAKAKGIVTGEPLMSAFSKCRDLVVRGADMEAYRKYSRLVRKIYEEYTDRVEPFGIDECWLDITNSIKLFGSAKKIADEIRERVKAELGLTVSVGISFNKIYAKLASDMKKPDATTIIDRENYISIMKTTPVKDLLMVGKKTQKKLELLGIRNIFDIVDAGEAFFKEKFGKVGEDLFRYAIGEDEEEVKLVGERDKIKSVGNSTTLFKNINKLADVEKVFLVLSDSVGTRLREKRLKGCGIGVSVRDADLEWHSFQEKSLNATSSSETIFTLAMNIFKKNYHFHKPIRSLGVRVYDIGKNENAQFDLFNTVEVEDKRKGVEEAVDKIRKKYGYSSIRKSSLIVDEVDIGINANFERHTFPSSFQNEEKKKDKK